MRQPFSQIECWYNSGENWLRKVEGIVPKRWRERVLRVEIPLSEKIKVDRISDNLFQILEFWMVKSSSSTSKTHTARIKTTRWLSRVYWRHQSLKMWIRKSECISLTANILMFPFLRKIVLKLLWDRHNRPKLGMAFFNLEKSPTILSPLNLIDTMTKRLMKSVSL